MRLFKQLRNHFPINIIFCICLLKLFLFYSSLSPHNVSIKTKIVEEICEKLMVRKIPSTQKNK